MEMYSESQLLSFVAAGVSILAAPDGSYLSPIDYAAKYYPSLVPQLQSMYAANAAMYAFNPSLMNVTPPPSVAAPAPVLSPGYSSSALPTTVGGGPLIQTPFGPTFGGIEGAAATAQRIDTLREHTMPRWVRTGALVVIGILVIRGLL